MNLNELIEPEKLKPGAKKWVYKSKIAEEISAYIETHCNEILSIYRKNPGYFLLRGTRFNLSKILLGKSWDKRKSKDTPQDIQNKVDNKLKESGFKALRSNSIFCAANMAMAESYGTAYVIFPTDGFSYMWSTEAKDFYNRFKPAMADSKIHEDLKLLSADDFVKIYGFQNNKDLITAMHRGCEICINCSYVGIRYYSEQWSSIRIKLGV